ncbi:MAG TPA: acyltransferase [Micromonosporaceae bacterium]
MSVTSIPDHHPPILTHSAAERSAGAEGSGRPQPTTLPALTGMRWLAAALVFAFHICVVEYFDRSVEDTILRPLFGSGDTGVSFFFILSGFVLAWSARPGDRPVRFWRRRLARVYPLHLVTALLALLLAVTVWPETDLSALQIVSNLLLVHSWNPDYHYSQSLNPVSWSLACEAFFYGLFPLLMPMVRRLRPGSLYAVGLGCVVAVVLVPLVAGGTWVHFVPAARLPEFVLGIVLAELVRGGHWRGPGLGVSCGVLLIGYAAAEWVPPVLGFAACTVLGFALVIPAAATAELRGRVTWLAHPVMVRLGELSFAFYMIHIIVMRTGESLFTPHPQLATLPALGATAAAFTVSLALSWALYVLVERPARRFLLGRRSSGPAAPRQATETAIPTGRIG